MGNVHSGKGGNDGRVAEVNITSTSLYFLHLNFLLVEVMVWSSGPAVSCC